MSIFHAVKALHRVIGDQPCVRQVSNVPWQGWRASFCSIPRTCLCHGNLGIETAPCHHVTELSTYLPGAPGLGAWGSGLR